MIRNFSLRRKQINSYTFSMKDFLENQSDNLFLWVPFLMAFGGGMYFNIPWNPNIIIIILGIVTAIILLFCLHNRGVRAFALFLFGFCYSAIFTQIINTPQIPRDLHNLDVCGTVEHIDYTNNKSRIYIKLDASDIHAGDGTAIVRVSASSSIPPPNVGDKIRAKIGLFRPNGPDGPETFDYARWAYFNGLSANGYMNDYDVIAHASGHGIATLRNSLHKSANSFLADTLVLGYKNAVPKSDSSTWTATGVGHVWSISGFHITLVSAWLFAIFYLLFRAIAPITRRIPARIPALICAWIGLMFYLFLSGCDVATVRAFLMATLVFMAFIFGRNAISVRNVCVAFCIIFLINPHYVMQPGFQLSFAAIFGLVWLWNDVRPKMPNNKILKVIYTAILTSVVATIFTTPFVIAHFYSMPIYGLIGNLVLLPVFSVAIMPMVMLGIFTAPLFGWSLPLDVAEKIYQFTLGIATKISSMPMTTITMPHITNVALGTIIIGFLCLMFIRPIRIKINWILCAVFFAIGITIICTTQPPVFYVTHDHELAAFVGPDNKLEFTKSRASNHYFTFDTWKHINGEDAGTKNIRRAPVDGVWVYKTQKFTLAYIQKFVPLMRNIEKLCNDDDIDYIVSFFDVQSKQCNHKILRGGFVIYPNGKIKYLVNSRPWHNPPE